MAADHVCQIDLRSNWQRNMSCLQTKVENVVKLLCTAYVRFLTKNTVGGLKDGWLDYPNHNFSVWTYKQNNYAKVQDHNTPA